MVAPFECVIVETWSSIPSGGNFIYFELPAQFCFKLHTQMVVFLFSHNNELKIIFLSLLVDLTYKTMVIFNCHGCRGNWVSTYVVNKYIA